MTRNELKQLWFSIPRDENKKDYKVIVVEIGKKSLLERLWYNRNNK